MKNSSNLFDWNYRYLADTLPRPAFPLIDAHCHINGLKTAELYLEAAKSYGFTKAWSMSQLEEVDRLQNLLGDFIEFIAFPRIRGENPIDDHGAGYVARIKEFKKRGSKIAKFWCAPRIFDFSPGDFADHPLRIDSDLRRPSIEKAVESDMKLMVHISDPDVWFSHTYLNAKHYGNKLQQYDLLEWLLETYKVPTIAAHMAGFPEDLDFLDRLLLRHDNLFLDTSATKWMLREISKHPVDKLLAFFSKWSNRILFGTDIVTMDSHLETTATNEMASKASNEKEAFDLYASRFWAMRTLFESSRKSLSPIYDPDHGSVQFEFSGIDLPREILEKIFFKNAQKF